MEALEKISFQDQSEEIKGRVEKYWTKRADSFFELRKDEVDSSKAKLWLQEIQSVLPEDKDLQILDIGCGAGFFEAIMGSAGYFITGVDLTEEMIQKAKEMIQIRSLDETRVSVQQMDAEKLDFPDACFDVIITRNLTWTLPHPIEAYREWFRVLKRGGILLNFDAEYAKHADTNLYSEENKSHESVTSAMKDECNAIYHMLTISTLDRPKWDQVILREIGFSEVTTDITFGDRIYKEKDRFYMPDRMFSVKALK